MAIDIKLNKDFNKVMANKFNEWRNGKKYLAKLNLRQKIQAEIASQLAIMREADNCLNDRIDLENSPEMYGVNSNRFLVVGQPIKLDFYPDLLTVNSSCYPRIRLQTRNIGKNWSI